MTRLRFQVPTGVTVTVTLRPESVTAADFTVPVTRYYRLITGRDFQRQHRDSGRGFTSHLNLKLKLFASELRVSLTLCVLPRASCRPESPTACRNCNPSDPDVTQRTSIMVCHCQ
jgi:hypothetical protein